LKLYGKLLLSMVAAGALALVALALTLNWRLGQGFVNYINAADAERLPAIAAALAEHHREQGGWDALENEPRRWREVLRRARELDEQRIEPATPLRGRVPTPDAADRASADSDPGAGATARGDRRAVGTADPVDQASDTEDEADRPRRAEPWTPMWSRLAVFDPEQRRIVGRHRWDPSARRVAIEVDGVIVGWVTLREVGEVRSHVAEAFLADQRRDLVLASLVMLAALGIAAALLARAWTRPIRRIGNVARHLAGGDFGGRVGAAGRDEIGQLARDIDFLAQSLQQADAARKRTMADTAHELRTPLAVLKGELEALLDGIRPLDRTAITSLHAEATHLGVLIDELRELAMADVGGLDYRMQTVDLAALLRDCFEASAGRLQQRPLAVALDVPARAVAVQGDPRRLRQLFENLIENALRYTDAGGCLQVGLSCDRNRACIRFDDTAPGVPDDMLPLLFEPFVRADAARSRASGGSGLGLAICRRIVDAHGGSIDAAASPLGGLRITVQLPLRTN
jgi:two-component system sensor histidine kinase BaeS